MGKKQKIGKQRRDKFYSLAKEVGYRSRAAFKLIQLNRTFRFLESSKICVDLCAAPGGWLQVASRHMPVSSLLIGVDLFPIKPISDSVKTIQADIVSTKCRMEIDRILAGNKVDLVLHDGAPNMGTNWFVDAYTQNVLVLRSAEIACGLLRKGGWFVSKIFRSRDYLALQWVLKQLFGRVQMTKPQASRAESAEIFVVCADFLAPHRIDQKFFEAKNVFGELGEVADSAADKTLSVEDVVGRRKPKVNKEGYPEGRSILYKKISGLEFVRADSDDQCLRMLMEATEMELDDERLISSASKDVLHTITDLKRQGKREIRALLKWRRRIRPLIVGEGEGKLDKVEDDDEVSVVVDSEDEINELLEKDADERARKDKRKKRLLAKQRLRMSKGHENMSLFDDVHQDQDLNFRRDLVLKAAAGQKSKGWFDQEAIKQLIGEEMVVGDIDDVLMRDVRYDDFEGESKSKNADDKKPKKEEEKKVEKLSPTELAIGHALVQSKRSREAVIDEGYHRFTGFGDDENDLPDWFVEDERRHCRKLPESIIDPAIVREYESRGRGLNVRSAKKVLEAKARKLKRDRKRLKKISTKVDEIPDELEPSERRRRIAEIYKSNRVKTNKKRVQYVIAKKSGSLRVGGSAKGGRVKLVDKRMKKDKRTKRQAGMKKKKNRVRR